MYTYIVEFRGYWIAQHSNGRYYLTPDKNSAFLFTEYKFGGSEYLVAFNDIPGIKIEECTKHDVM